MSERITLKRGKRPAAPKRRGGLLAPAQGTRRKAKARGGLLAPALSLGAAAIALFAAWLYQLPDKLWMAAAVGVADAGFEVKTVEVSWLKHMNRLPVYTAALDGASDSMLLVDLDEVRSRLLLLPWVKEASVGRQLPDTLSISITERQPYAIWQHRGRHRLVDADGAVLPVDDIARYASLPIVVGVGANREAAKLMALLHDFPAAAKHVAGAVWIGERRWDLKLKSGETLALPGDYADARTALSTFVRIDRDSGLVDKGFARFDMRLADRLTVRVASKDEDVAVRPQSGRQQAVQQMGGTEI